MEPGRAKSSTAGTPASLMMGRDLRLPIDLHIGHPENETSTSTTAFAEELERRLERVHRFAHTNLKVVSDRMNGTIPWLKAHPWREKSRYGPIFHNARKVSLPN